MKTIRVTLLLEDSYISADKLHPVRYKSLVERTLKRIFKNDITLKAIESFEVIEPAAEYTLPEQVLAARSAVIVPSPRKYDIGDLITTRSVKTGDFISLYVAREASREEYLKQDCDKSLDMKYYYELRLLSDYEWAAKSQGESE